MGRLLLLYDTDDKDFARDVSDFIGELGVQVEMIARAPDGGLTLQGKSDKFFDEVDAMLFVITPGSERHGVIYPSPSVADEMGRAKERFKEEPWRVIYLVDSKVTVQAVDQRSYIPFKRDDHRVVVEAMRRLIAGLKDARLFRNSPPPAPAPQVNVADIVTKTPVPLKVICRDVANQPNGTMWYMDFQKLVRQSAADETEANLAIRDLQQRGLVVYVPPQQVGMPGVISLTSIGWELVRVERAIERQRQEREAFERFGVSPAGMAMLAALLRNDPPGSS